MIIRIYNVVEAQKTILKRRPLHKISYAPQTLQRTEAVFGEGVTPPMAVSQILDDIEQRGDAALQEWSYTLDKYEGNSIVIGAEAIHKAFEAQEEEFQATIKESAVRIRQFYERQPVTNWLTDEMGGKLGQRFTPIERVGVYVPGGTAPLPSSLLMSVIPAQVAGVKQIVVCTPPNPHPSILACAYICGIEQIVQAGGAQAIAAMAFGTLSVPKVDKIVGAGNLFVTLAKQQLYGTVGLDGLAGPTETMVIADGTATPAWVAADLMAQAEHDWQASAILLTPDKTLAAQVQAQVEEQVAKLSRKEIITVSMQERGGIVLTESIGQAAELANQYAAEHLCLSVADPQQLMEQINNAGGIFLGEHSFEVLGDYVAGPSHVMPTGGTARFAAPLNVLDFVKLSSVIALDTETAERLSPVAARFAEAEKLTAHANAARLRTEDES